jgi:HAD superfamily hydrolase (TIGR01549 family)
MHISFDFDYTLADSAEGTVVCVNYAFKKLGMNEKSAEEIKKTIGLNLTTTYSVLCGGGATSALAEKFENYFLSYAEQVMLGHIRLYDGTVHALRSLKSEGHYISIVSTKRKERILEALFRDGLQELVDDVVGGSCVKNNKPDPEGLMLAIKRAGGTTRETIFVGDSLSDAECAHRAGVGFVGVLSGQTDGTQLSKWKPLALLQDINGIPPFIFALDASGTTISTGMRNEKKYEGF